MLWYTLLSVMLLSCSKSNDHQPFTDTAKATLSIEFNNVVGTDSLVLGAGNYRNSSGEVFSVSLLQYFISNISVRKADGTIFTVPQDSSYFLIKAQEPSTRFARVSVPEGDYVAISFLLGIDSLRNTADISKRTGVLEPAGDMENGMYWGWNSGYIFFKMEGISGQAPMDPSGQHKFRYHIGGFGGYSAPTINNIRKVTIDLTPAGKAVVRAGGKSNVCLMVDVARMFDGLSRVSIASNPTVMFGAYSASIANNFPGMFRHSHTENQQL